MHNLSKSQKSELLKNPNVEKITDKHVVFTSKFKVQAVEAYLSGQSQDLIFSKAGINLDWFIPYYARDSIKKWKKKYTEQGAESFYVETRGLGATGRPKNENFNELTYEELLAVVEIQKEVISDLKKRNALAKKKRLKS